MAEAASEASPSDTSASEIAQDSEGTADLTASIAEPCPAAATTAAEPDSCPEASTSSGAAGTSTAPAAAVDGDQLGPGGVSAETPAADAQHTDVGELQPSVQESATEEDAPAQPAQHAMQEAAAQSEGHTQPAAEPGAGLPDQDAAAQSPGGRSDAAEEASGATAGDPAAAHPHTSTALDDTSAATTQDAGAQAAAAADAGAEPSATASAMESGLAAQQAQAGQPAEPAAAAEQAPAVESGAEQARAEQPEAAAEPEQGAEPEDEQHSMEAAAPAAAAADAQRRQPDRAFFVDGVRAIDVEVDCGPGPPCKLLRVLMDVSGLQPSTKPYLGGFRHKQSGTTFHHASMQTPVDQTQAGKKGVRQHAGAVAAAAGGAGDLQPQDGACWVGQKLTCETQTVKASACSSQAVREASTQMAAPGLLLDCSGDRVLTPRPYVSSEVVQQRHEAAARTIQRFARGWCARRRAAVLRGIKQERDAFLAETAAEAAQSAQDHRRREVERRTHPLSAADFALLESELEAWRQQQTAAIKAAGLDKQEEQAALQLLLAKETRLLHTLDRLRTVANQQRRASGRQQTLGRLAQPKAWTLSNGKKVLVHTPLTVHAAELQQLYHGLTLSSLSTDERLDVLLHVKWVVREWDCAATRELLELIDREADLLNRGRSPKTLDGLRKRIAGLFLTCCQNPAFNPEAARLRVNAVGPQGPEAFEYDLAEQRAAV